LSAFFTCPRGHRWEADAADRGAATLGHAVCPVCGDASQTLADVPLPSQGDLDSTTQPLGDLPVEAASDHELPALHGYEILGELARGGMGVVYKARQKGLNRVVALKMILSGAHAGPAEVARFRVEAEAVARLQHPHIVQIYEVGEAQGLPFFSLEFIDGGSLDAQLAGAPQPPRAAAELVAILAEAMHHAHEHGIIHRDLKPANVLLSSVGLSSEFLAPDKDTLTPSYGLRTTAYGLPKISDFGLAKPVTGESGLTRTGAVVGTPSYMAPEQANNERVGPAADTYALGAILYEMLTGRPPFRASTAVDTIMQVIAEEPVAPSRLQPKLPVDLETICLKCLEKDSGKRYPTALALAEDLRHFLAGEPIQARPTGMVRRLVKWAKRRPAVAGLIGVSSAAVLVLAGVITASILGLKEQRDFAREQRDLATAAKEDADLQRQHAETSFERARAAVDRMLTRVGDEKLRNVPLMEQLQRDLLEDALKFNQQFLEERGSDASVRKEASLAYLRAAGIRGMLGQQDQAVAAYREAIQLQQQLADEAPDDTERAHALIRSFEALGSELAETNQVAEAEQAYRTAFGLLEGLMRRSPDIPEYRRDLASLHNLQGNLFSRTSRWEEVEKSYRQALAIQDALVAEFPKVPDYRREQAQTLDFLGLRLVAMQRQDEAEKALQKAVDTMTALVAEFPREAAYRQDLVQCQFNLATMRAERGRSKEAEESFRKTVQLQSALVADFPRVPSYRQALAKYYYNLGLVCESSNRRQDTLEAYRQSAALGEALVAEFPKVPAYQEELAGTLNNMSLVLSASGQKAEAEKVCRRGIHHLEPLVAEFPKTRHYLSQLGNLLAGLADLLRDRNALPEAKQALERAIDLQRTARKLSPAQLLYTKLLHADLVGLADLHLREKDYTAAAATAGELGRTLSKDAQAHYNVACILARCAPLAASDDRLTDAKRKELERSYGDQAMAALQSARQDGFKDVALLKKDGDLDTLRARPDFQELLVVMEKGK
jgi:tetratricopeptide (TPR) repeat protein